MPDTEGRLRPRGRRPDASGRHRNVYVSDADRAVWEQADEFARERGVSLSSVVADALARYLAHPPQE
jgi:hypothetical protein